MTEREIHTVDNEFGIMGGDALAMDAMKNATIERCAQVAEEYLKSKGYNGTKTAAAIRELKLPNRCTGTTIIDRKPPQESDR